jgi:ABC-type multidrug transport system ATPase subunit
LINIIRTLFGSKTKFKRCLGCFSGWRQILNSLNGKFRCGELTAILGPSGAGKSSLLNILAGFVTSGVKGIVKVNDQPRNMKLFNKLSSYIMQEDMIQPRLTVKEALTYAACLKLSSHIEYSVKLAVVSARGNKSATTILF